MIEGRAVIQNINKTRKKLEELGAIFKSYYVFKDIVFVPKKENYNLNDSFLRIRVHVKSNWPTKKVVLIRKKAEFKKIGKIDKIVLKKEFDTEKEATDFISEELSNEFKHGFEYSREGWEYYLMGKRIFLENIEHFQPSIEIEAESEKEILDMFSKIGIIEQIHDSIPETMRKLFFN